MNHSSLFAFLLLASPLALHAQTTPSAAPRQVTEVTEDLDPATGKVVRRTTRTYTAPADTPVAATAPARATTPARTNPAARPTAAPATRPAPTTRPVPAPAVVAEGRATDAQVTTFLGRKTAVSTLSASALVNVYAAFIEKVRTDRHGWRTADWTTAANVLSALNNRYEQLRSSFSLDDKLSIRSQQAEFQALRTTRQLTDQVTDKL